jgi:hypothetical protein
MARRGDHGLARREGLIDLAEVTDQTLLVVHLLKVGQATFARLSSYQSGADRRGETRHHRFRLRGYPGSGGIAGGTEALKRRRSRADPPKQVRRTNRSPRLRCPLPSCGSAITMADSPGESWASVRSSRCSWPQNVLPLIRTAEIYGIQAHCAGSLRCQKFLRTCLVCEETRLPCGQEFRRIGEEQAGRHGDPLRRGAPYHSMVASMPPGALYSFSLTRIWIMQAPADLEYRGKDGSSDESHRTADRGFPDAPAAFPGAAGGHRTADPEGMRPLQATGVVAECRGDDCHGRGGGVLNLKERSAFPGDRDREFGHHPSEGFELPLRRPDRRGTELADDRFATFDPRLLG